jgi:hypothetical protein
VAVGIAHVTTDLVAAVLGFGEEPCSLSAPFTIGLVDVCYADLQIGADVLQIGWRRDVNIRRVGAGPGSNMRGQDVSCAGDEVPQLYGPTG